MKRLSIITPCYNEEANVEACYQAVREIFARTLPGYEYEHIFADNASIDGTVEILLRLAKQDPRVKIIVNSHNVGPFRNTFNALKSTTGDGILLLLAADLQDPPELIPAFVREWEKGYKIVYGVRTNRQEKNWLRLARWAYYRLVRKFSHIDIPVDTGEFQFIDRSVRDSLCATDDYYPYLRGMIAQTGLASIGIPYQWGKRLHGKSRNNLYNLIDQALNGIISTTNVPMRICTLIGLILALCSVTYSLIQFAINLIEWGAAPPGIATLVTALFFFGGVQLFFIGILGEYITAIHSQLRRGPKLIETLRVNFDKDAANP
ncbi:MAG TPA: glycosyltransferase family 2 protein [Dongiaceae bacterium]|jgi:glycosyltransferase involved in cell wall biosynthesis|nr:glycosyltransferase family 2 protein [Dongiaceae bacterium]